MARLVLLCLWPLEVLQTVLFGIFYEIYSEWDKLFFLNKFDLLHQNLVKCFSEMNVDVNLLSLERKKSYRYS